MRGIQCAAPGGRGTRRISPAHAGNTLLFPSGVSGRADQPRTCGEYDMHLRMLDGLMRISPAHAGNTRSRWAGCGRNADQPRTCGEYRVRPGSRRPTGGSAPHMRGIREDRTRGPENQGISPAHAGNTVPAQFPDILGGDQPRTCGEYAPRARADPRSGGSAPHMRGIRRPRRVRDLEGRISPAHAGNTAICVPGPNGNADQPRTCGEYFSDCFYGVLQVGSAPHMRGILR